MREATDYQDDQPIPGRLGQTVTVQGIITGGPIPLSYGALLADLQDSTGGITLFSPNIAVLKASFQRSDELRVTGTIQQHKGQTEILILIGFLVVLSAVVSGCGGGSYSQGQPGGSLFPADVSGTYMFTLTGTGGSLTLHGSFQQTQWTPCNGNLLCNGATYEKQS